MTTSLAIIYNIAQIYTYIWIFWGKIADTTKAKFILSRTFVSMSYQLFQGEDFWEEEKKQPLTQNGI